VKGAIPGTAVNNTNPKKGSPMTDDVRNKDDAKGRLKEAAGSLTDDEDLKREGKVDKTSGKVKEGLDKAADKVKDALRRD
jgi:uncharacterized protein YjbJ (UPF0337 family)